jgi:hypothetical protein
VLVLDVNIDIHIYREEFMKFFRIATLIGFLLILFGIWNMVIFDKGWGPYQYLTENQNILSAGFLAMTISSLAIFCGGKLVYNSLKLLQKGKGKNEE